jgi:hypothetical protein
MSSHGSCHREPVAGRLALLEVVVVMILGSCIVEREGFGCGGVVVAEASETRGRMLVVVVGRIVVEGGRQRPRVLAAVMRELRGRLLKVIWSEQRIVEGAVKGG